MSPEQPPTNPNDEPRPFGQPDDGGTTVGPIDRAAAAATCPSCGQPLEPGLRFCQACGAAVGEDAEVPAEAADEKTQPWLILVTALWLVIAAAALYFLYSYALVIGST